VPQPIAEAVEPAPVVALAQPAIFVQIRNVADFRMLQTPPATGRRGAADLERAEPGSEIAQLRVVEALAAKHQHRIAVDRLPDRADGSGIDRLGEVDAVGLGGKQRMKLAQFKGHAIFPSTSASHTASRRPPMRVKRARTSGFTETRPTTRSWSSMTKSGASAI
jgi:hypothetical protein